RRPSATACGLFFAVHLRYLVCLVHGAKFGTPQRLIATTGTRGRGLGSERQVLDSSDAVMGRRRMCRVYAAVVLTLAITGVASAQQSQNIPAQLQQIQNQLDALAASINSLTTAAPRLRTFYLTPNAAVGDHALSACAAGYHMANLFEIHELTTL